MDENIEYIYTGMIASTIEIIGLNIKKWESTTIHETCKLYLKEK